MPYSEITYHKDGNLQNKLFTVNRAYKEGEDLVKKIPLSKVDDVLPILKYNVVDYNICKKGQNANDELLLPMSKIFNGEPFECFFCLINMKYATPSTDEEDDITFRITDIAKNIDLLIFVRKSNYKGKVRLIPNTNIEYFDTNNVVTKLK